MHDMLAGKLFLERYKYMYTCNCHVNQELGFEYSSDMPIQLVSFKCITHLSESIMKLTELVMHRYNRECVYKRYATNSVCN